MAYKMVSVPVTLKMQEDVAAIVARAELQGVYSEKNAEIKLTRLAEDGISEDNLKKYFEQLSYLVTCFAQDKRDLNSKKLVTAGFGFAELRMLYLPTLTATILSQVGDCKIGNYMVEVQAPEGKVKVDRNFIIEMSEALYRNRDILFSEKDQIGVANVQINPDFMCNIVTACESRVAEVLSKDGTNPDIRMKLLATLAGISLVNATYSILYPVVDYVSYGTPSDYYHIDNKEH